MKVVTFGEIMLKLSPINYQRFLQAREMMVEFAGAEANVAVSLANYGMRVQFVSKLPDNDFGDAAINSLRKYGVDTTMIVRGGNRLGIYFSEKGASQRPSRVIYDRKESSISCAASSDFNWNSIFDGVSWFHFTGITPALSDSLAVICLEACKEAKKKGITISCDLNYRKQLWSREKASKVMTELCKYVDVCIVNEEDAEDVFGIKAEHSDVRKGIIDEHAYVAVAQKLQHQFDFKFVAITLRESVSASDNNWSAILFDGETYYNSSKYSIHLVDRIGGGDSFCAGLIYGLQSYNSPQKALEFAVASSCLKQTIEGDLNLVSVSEVESLMNGNASGRISR